MTSNTQSIVTFAIGRSV